MHMMREKAEREGGEEGGNKYIIKFIIKYLDQGTTNSVCD
jgi:hypothetical protein